MVPPGNGSCWKARHAPSSLGIGARVLLLGVTVTSRPCRLGYSRRHGRYGFSACCEPGVGTRGASFWQRSSGSPRREGSSAWRQEVGLAEWLSVGAGAGPSLKGDLETARQVGFGRHRASCSILRPWERTWVSRWGPTRRQGCSMNTPPPRCTTTRCGSTPPRATTT